MRSLICISFILLTACAFAQQRDTVHVDTGKRLVMLPFNPTKMPLIVIDGFIYKGKIENIDPNQILDVYRLDQPGATNIYGDAGKNGVLLIKTLKEGRWEYQHGLRRISIAYDIYLQAKNDDDSGLTYTINGIVLNGSEFEITKKLDHVIETVKTVDLIGEFSDKPNTNDKKLIVAITTRN